MNPTALLAISNLLASSGVPDEMYVRETMKTICNVPCPEDGLVFDLDSLRISMIRSEQAFPSQRAKLNCYLGSARILTQVDFGFGDVVTAGAEQSEIKDPHWRCPRTLVARLSAVDKLLPRSLKPWCDLGSAIAV